jgi:hypothetical protein
MSYGGYLYLDGGLMQCYIALYLQPFPYRVETTQLQVVKYRAL